MANHIPNGKKRMRRPRGSVSTHARNLFQVLIQAEGETETRSMYKQ